MNGDSDEDTTGCGDWDVTSRITTRQAMGGGEVIVGNKLLNDSSRRALKMADCGSC